MTQIDPFLSEWTAAERDGDTATLDTLLTDDFVGVGPLGFTLPRPAWLSRHQQGDLTYETFDLDEMETRLHRDTALVIARLNTRGAYQGHPIPEAVRATLVLVNEAGSWRLAGIHMSFVAGTRGAPPIPGVPAPTPSEGDQRLHL